MATGGADLAGGESPSQRVPSWAHGAVLGGCPPDCTAPSAGKPAGPGGDGSLLPSAWWAQGHLSEAAGQPLKRTVLSSSHGCHGEHTGANWSHMAAISEGRGPSALDVHGGNAQTPRGAELGSVEQMVISTRDTNKTST